MYSGQGGSPRRAAPIRWRRWRRARARTRSRRLARTRPAARAPRRAMSAPSCTPRSTTARGDRRGSPPDGASRTRLDGLGGTTPTCARISRRRPPARRWRRHRARPVARARLVLHRERAPWRTHHGGQRGRRDGEPERASSQKPPVRYTPLQISSATTHPRAAAAPPARAVGAVASERAVAAARCDSDARGAALVDGKGGVDVVGGGGWRQVARLVLPQRRRLRAREDGGAGRLRRVALRKGARHDQQEREGLVRAWRGRRP